MISKQAQEKISNKGRPCATRRKSKGPREQSYLFAVVLCNHRGMGSVRVMGTKTF